MPLLTFIAAIAGLIFGLIGAVLGVLNTWRAWDRDRIKLRVSTVWHATPDRSGNGIGVEVVNLGYIPITISELGFYIPRRINWDEAFSLSKQSLPHRLEPRAAFHALLPTDPNDEKFNLVTGTYAKTACGLRVDGSRRNFRECLNAARASAKRAQ